MYLWFGINIDNQLTDFKKDIYKLSDKYDAITQFAFHPAHISLKISFEINGDMFEEILNDVTKFYKSIEPFEINSDKVEIENYFIWLRWHNNSNLERIHKDLCDIVNSKYNIQLHEFDFDYKFHTTLFTNSHTLDTNLINEILKLNFPNKIYVNEFFVEPQKIISQKIIKFINQ